MNDSTTIKGTALVTGAANRLGASLARGLAANGYRVIIHYSSSRDDAETLAAEIGHDIAATAMADLTSDQARAALIDAAGKPFGPLTLLVNNASLFERDSADTLDEDVWDRHFALHAKTPAFLAQAFATQLPAGQTGNIINIIDERVLHPAPAAFSYHLSKSVLWMATRTLAQSYAPRIRVNAIGPGPILPEAGQSQSDFDRRSADNLLQHAASPADAVQAMLFLLNAPTITGQMLAIDGGEHLGWQERRGPTPRP